MNIRNLQLSRRGAVIAAVAAVVVGLGGWALAEGAVPVVSSGASDAPSTNSTSTTSPASPGASTDNVAAAVNTTDGKTVYAISLKIVQTDADRIDATNAAVAVASCDDCQTVAIALEAVLVIGEPSTFDPTNLALAINSGCTNCETLASAYQHIVQNDTRVRISGAGRRQIAAVRAELQSLRTSGLDVVTIQERVDAAVARFIQVLENEVYPIGRPADASTTTTAVAEPTSSTTTTTAPEEPTSTSTSAPVESTTTTTADSTSTTTTAAL